MRLKNSFKILTVTLAVIALFSCASVMPYSASASEQKMTEALLRNDIAGVKALLAHGASPDSRMPSGGAPVLSIPLQNNNLAMAKLLVDAGAQVNAKDRYDMPLLHLAKRAPMMRLLLEHGADKYAVYKNATAYEFFATRLVTTEADRKKFVEQLKAAKLTRSQYDAAVEHAEKTAWLTKQDIIDVVRTYKAFNYDVNRSFGENRQGVLHAAAFAENYELLTALIEETPADVNIRDKGDVSLLNIITQSDMTRRTAAQYEALVSLLVKKGVRIDAICGSVMDEQVTALMIAAHKKFNSRVATLIKLGANPNIMNENKKSALNFAKDLSSVKSLLDKGADALNKDKWGQTTIFYQTDPAVISLLLARGVDINAQDNEGHTALFSVREPKVVEFLVSKKININHRNKKNQSTMEADVAFILSAMRYDNDYQDHFIPKFKTLIRLGIDKSCVTGAYRMADAAKTGYDVRKVLACLKPHAGL